MLFLSVLTSLGFAAEPAFIAPFLSTDKAAEETADQIANIILDELDRNTNVTAKSVDEMESVHNVSAADYMFGCLPEEFVGCAFVVGKSGGVTYSVAGTVGPLERVV